MLNQAIVVGRISNYDAVAREVTISVPRTYKNMEGEYETDYIPIKLWGVMANQMELVKIGDLIGIKGRLQRTGVELRIVADKVTFLSQGNNEEAANEN